MRYSISPSTPQRKEPVVKQQEIIRRHREEILRLAVEHGARDIWVFGSVARDTADDVSDVDFLVEMEAGRSLLDLGGLQHDLEELLGCRVDLATERALKKRIRERVLQEAVPV